MKNDQKNMTIPNVHSVHLSSAPNYLNMEPSPPVHLSDRRPKPGKRSS